MSARSDMLRVKKVPLFIECTPATMYGLWRECLYSKDKYANEPVLGYSAFHCVARSRLTQPTSAPDYSSSYFTRMQAP